MKAKFKGLEFDCTPQEMAEFMLAHEASHVPSVPEQKESAEERDDSGGCEFALQKGNWYVCTKPRYADFIVGKVYFCPKDGMLNPGTMSRYVAKHCFRPWSIEDAMAGDVLVSCDGIIVMFKDFYNGSTFRSYCCIKDRVCHIDIGDGLNLWGVEGFRPASKEQRALLLARIGEAGYTWDAEEKEVKRMEREDWKQGVGLVDMGLPSGVKWADRNVGAKSPEDVGLYFSWGNVDGVEFGKACDFGEESYGKSEGVEMDGDLDAAHDAATVNMGGPWRMPTVNDFQELYDNCDWEFVEQNDYYGVRFTSKTNGNKLFFACSGYGSGHSWNSRGSKGCYWSSLFYSARLARYLYFSSGDVNPQNHSTRYYAFAVRAVQNKQ